MEPKIQGRKVPNRTDLSHPASAHTRQPKRQRRPGTGIPTAVKGQSIGGALHSVVELARVSTPPNLFGYYARIDATPWDGRDIQRVGI